MFGLCCRNADILEKRFFKVEKQDWNTLFPFILNKIIQITTLKYNKRHAYLT